MSAGRRLADGSKLQFDQWAAALSRSKLGLSRVLAQAGLAAVPRAPASSLEQAQELARRWPGPVVLRPDAGYSGRGVWVARSAEELAFAWDRCRMERAGADFVEMRAVMDEGDDDRLLVEPWLAGGEWSVDCIASPAGVMLIRLCEKSHAVVDGKPITLGYRLINAPRLRAEIQQLLEHWIANLLPPNVVSFACFDVGRLPGGELVPLDFGLRLGGDGIPHLVRRAGRLLNPYAAALDAALAGEPARLARLQDGLALVHVFARREGTFEGLEVELEGDLVDVRPPGYRIEPVGFGRAIRRVGSMVTQFDSHNEFIQVCRRSAEWSHVSVRPDQNPDVAAACG